MRVTTAEFGNVANIQRKQGNVVVQFRTAQLNVGGAVGSGAANVRTAGWIRGKSGFAGRVEKNETLHQFGARGGSEMRKGLRIAGSEEFFKGRLVVSAGGGKQIAQAQRKARRAQESARTRNVAAQDAGLEATGRIGARGGFLASCGRACSSRTAQPRPKREYLRVILSVLCQCGRKNIGQVDGKF